MMTPAFALDFTSAVLDARVSLARALNTATAVNSSGVISLVNANLPRFDYNPISLACRGLLVEGASENRALYSSDFRNTTAAGSTRPWTYTNATLQRTGTGPDGLTANKIVPNVGATDGRVNQGMPISSGVAYALSIYGKAAEHSTLNIVTNLTGTFRENRFNLSTGNIVSIGAGLVGSISLFKDGWYRCVLVGTSGTTSVTVQVRDSDTGDGTSGLLATGIQLEPGTGATSLIPTAGTITARNADVATITGTNFSDFWKAGNGGVLGRARPGTVSGARPWVQVDDNTTNNIIALRGNTTNAQFYLKAGGVDQATLNAGTIAANTAYNLNTSWNSNDCRARLDSEAMVSALLPIIPTVTQMRIGSDGTNYLDGWVETISYYDQMYIPGFSFLPCF